MDAWKDFVEGKPYPIGTRSSYENDRLTLAFMAGEGIDVFSKRPSDYEMTENYTKYLTLKAK